MFDLIIWFKVQSFSYQHWESLLFSHIDYSIKFREEQFIKKKISDFMNLCSAFSDILHEMLP